MEVAQIDSIASRHNQINNTINNIAVVVVVDE